MKVEFRNIEKLSKGIHMGFIDEIKSLGANDRTLEEKYYAEVLREIEAGKRRDGLWSRALSETDFDENKAKARYIKLRVQSLKDEVSITQKKMINSGTTVPDKSKTNIRTSNTNKDETPNTVLGFILFVLFALAGSLVGAVLARSSLILNLPEQVMKILFVIFILGPGYYGRYLGALLTNKIKKKMRKK